MLSLAISSLEVAELFVVFGEFFSTKWRLCHIYLIEGSRAVALVSNTDKQPCIASSQARIICRGSVGVVVELLSLGEIGGVEED